MCRHVEGVAARWGRAETRELAPAGGIRLPEQRKRREEGRREELEEVRNDAVVYSERRIEGWRLREEGGGEYKAEELSRLDRREAAVGSD
jgi:hypothetical protein